MRSKRRMMTTMMTPIIGRKSEAYFFQTEGAAESVLRCQRGLYESQPDLPMARLSESSHRLPSFPWKGRPTNLR